MGTIADKLTYLNDTKTAIKNAVVAKGVSVSDTDTFRSYADKIGQISGGGEPVAKTKYGISIDNLIGKYNEANGLYPPEDEFVADFSGVKKIFNSALYYKFASSDPLWNSGVTKILMPDVEEISGNSCEGMAENAYNLTEFYAPKIMIATSSSFSSAFYGASNLKTVDISGLTEISGYQACYHMFDGSGITELNLDNLTTISGSSACQHMFAYSDIVQMNFKSLTTISGSQACRYMFNACKSLIRVDYPALTSVVDGAFGSNSASTGIFANCDALTEIHFRADAQAMIEALQGYSVKWGATSSTIYFDL